MLFVQRNARCAQLRQTLLFTCTVVACALQLSLNRRVVAAAAGDVGGARRRVYTAGTPTVVEPAA